MAPKFASTAYDEDVNTPARNGPGFVALAMGFHAARDVISSIQVREMSAREFADLAVQLGYAFEVVLDDRKTER